MACAQANPDGLHAASVSTEKQRHQALNFGELDLIHDDVDALEYTTNRARIWIEANVRFPAPFEAASEC